MSKTSVADWDATAANNTDVGGISLGENVMPMSAVNDALREIMAQVAGAGFVVATDTTYYSVGGTDVAVADGGTGASTAAGALTNLGALPAAGGTIAGNLTVGGAVLSSAPLKVGMAGSGTGGNAQFIDDGGTKRWAVGVLGGVGETSFSIYDIVNSSTRLNVDATTGVVKFGSAVAVTAPTSSTFGIGIPALCSQSSGGSIADGGTVAGAYLKLASASASAWGAAGGSQSGTWKNITGISVVNTSCGYFVRTA